MCGSKRLNLFLYFFILNSLSSVWMEQSKRAASSSQSLGLWFITDIIKMVDRTIGWVTGCVGCLLSLTS